MAAKQLLPDPMAAADLKEYLLSTDDFAFEREIYHIASSLKLEVEHAGLYEDPLQGKQRQFDIRASHTLGNDRIELAIECKRLNPSFPLLVSCVPRSESEAFHQYLQSFRRVEGGNTYVKVESVRSSGPLSLYPAGRLVGKSMTQVGRDREKALIAGDRDTFDKWAQSLASIAEMVERALSHLSVRRAVVPRTAFLPVLVVPDDTLWGAKYSSSGELGEDPTKEAEITFYVGRRYHLESTHFEGAGQAELTVTHLHVCTRSAVGELLYGIANGGGIRQQLLP